MGLNILKLLPRWLRQGKSVLLTAGIPLRITAKHSRAWLGLSCAAFFLLLITSAPLALAAEGCLQASGGTLSTSSSGGTSYCVREFSSDGTFVWRDDQSENVEFLLVGDGGGAGSGGGGAGGLVRGSYTVSPYTSYSVTIGSGGSASTGMNDRGNVGGDSSAFGSTAGGGGATSAGSSANPTAPGGTGGSGYTSSLAGITRIYAVGGDAINANPTNSNSTPGSGSDYDTVARSGRAVVP